MGNKPQAALFAHTALQEKLIEKGLATEPVEIERRHSGAGQKNHGKKQQKRNLTPLEASKARLKNPLPNPMKYIGEGEDHILISKFAKTELGKILAMEFSAKFYHAPLGEFSSLHNFWHYVRSAERDDRVRHMSDLSLRKFSDKLTHQRVPSFKAIVMDGLWQRLQANQKHLALLAASTLPFDNYYRVRDSGLIKRSQYAHWYISGVEEIRAALVEGRLPDFTYLMDSGHLSLEKVFEKEFGIKYDVQKPEKEKPKKKKNKTKEVQKADGEVKEPVAEVTTDEQQVPEAKPPAQAVADVIDEGTGGEATPVADVVEETPVSATAVEELHDNGLDQDDVARAEAEAESEAQAASLEEAKSKEEAEPQAT